MALYIKIIFKKFLKIYTIREYHDRKGGKEHILHDRQWWSYCIVSTLH